jgi:hypothetical protein
MIEHETGSENQDDDLMERVWEVESFDALYALLGELESQGKKIQGSQQSYSIPELKDLIEKVRSGASNIDRITRAEGLREKVIQLLKKERANDL